MGQGCIRHSNCLKASSSPPNSAHLNSAACTCSKRQINKVRNSKKSRCQKSARLLRLNPAKWAGQSTAGKPAAPVRQQQIWIIHTEQHASKRRSSRAWIMTWICSYRNRYEMRPQKRQTSPLGTCLSTGARWKGHQALSKRHRSL